MSAAEVVTIHPTDTQACLYSMSQEHYNTVMGTVSLGRGVIECIKRLDLITSCFKKQGPPGDAQAFDGEFQRFFGEVRNQGIATTTHREIFPYIESLTSLKAILDQGCTVLDIGCGTGTLTLTFAERYPNSIFSGLEVSEDAFAGAITKLDDVRKDVHNASFRLGTADGLFDDIGEASFDVAMLFQVLHNLPDPLKMIDDVNRILKPGGKLILLDSLIHSNHSDNVGDMKAALSYTFSQFFCLPFSMSDKPHVGYGMGWGQEDMLKALGEILHIRC